MKDLSGFIRGEIVINCETQDEFRGLKEEIEMQDIKTYPIHVICNKDTYLKFENGLISWGNIEHGRKKGYTIVRYPDLPDKEDKPEFSPTKTFLMAHKDEYVMLCEGSLYKVNKQTTVDLNEDLTDKRNSIWDIEAIYKKVWQRDTLRMTTAEIVKAYEELIGRPVEVVEKCDA